MSTIAIFGITGYTGGAVARELLNRGHQVTGVSRDVSAVPPAPGLTVLPGSIHDEATVAKAAQGADAIIVALPARETGGHKLIDALPSLLSAAQAAGARLGIMGGAGSLKVSEDGPLLIDTPEFPDEYKDEAGSAQALLEALRGSDTPVDWFFVSPAAEYGSYNPGSRTGKFRIGGDVLLTNAEGHSALSAEDLAIAFADEIESPAHHRQRFTVAY